MADPTQAIQLALKNEDASGKGVIVIDNNGYKVKYGINAQDNPDLWDENHPDGPSLSEAIARYTSQYWPSAFSALTSQHEANFILDLSINMGKYHAAKIFQRAIARCGAIVTIDGVIGAETVAAANSCGETSLINFIVQEADAYYEEIVQANPQDAPYLKTWLARVKGDAALPLDASLASE